MTDCKSRSKLLKEVQIASFAVVETNLYLDTHPYDTVALAALEAYSKKREEAIKKYEALYGPLFPFSIYGENDYYRWIKEPFPWEKED